MLELLAFLGGIIGVVIITLFVLGTIVNIFKGTKRLSKKTGKMFKWYFSKDGDPILKGLIYIIAFILICIAIHHLDS